jgi:hypothetical protein
VRKTSPAPDSALTAADANYFGGAGAVVEGTARLNYRSGVGFDSTPADCTASSTG